MKKGILAVCLIVLLLSFGSFFASSQSVVKDTLYIVQLEQGWNLVYGFYNSEDNLNFIGPAIGLKDEINAENIKAVYGFVPTIQEYAQVYPEIDYSRLNLIDDDEMSNTAFLVYSDKAGTLYHKPARHISVSRRPVYKGWNFIGLTEEVIESSSRPDLTFDEIKGNCEVEKAYLFLNGDWQKFDYPEMDSTLLGRGMAIKVQSDCNLGVSESEGGVAPPPLPGSSLTREQCTNLGGSTFDDPGDSSLGGCPQGYEQLGTVYPTIEGSWCCKLEPIGSEIDTYGENLAKWADKNHELIKINGLQIQGVGPNAGGYSDIYYGGFYGTEEGNDDYGGGKTETFRINLNSIISASSCQKSALDYLSTDFKDDTKTEMLSKIGCLGNFEFAKLSEGLL